MIRRLTVRSKIRCREVERIAEEVPKAALIFEDPPWVIELGLTCAVLV
jgi:hypothetical protein